MAPWIARRNLGLVVVAAGCAGARGSAAPGVPSGVRGKIINETPITVTERDVAWIGREHGREYICLGSWISASHMVTAAGCMVSASNFTAVYRFSQGGPWREANFIPHEEYVMTATIRANDIALVRVAVDESAESEPTVDVARASPVLVTGDLVQAYIGLMEWVTLPVLSVAGPGGCRSMYPDVPGLEPAGTMCTNNPSICAGGYDHYAYPLVTSIDGQDVLHGIGGPCAEPGVPAVYTRVGHYWEWINEHLPEHEKLPGYCSDACNGICYGPGADQCGCADGYQPGDGKCPVPALSTPTLECNPSFEGWVDSSGIGCLLYMLNEGWCPDASSWANSTGTSALHACTACRRCEHAVNNSEPTTPSSTTTSEQTTWPPPSSTSPNSFVLAEAQVCPNGDAIVPILPNAMIGRTRCPEDLDLACCGKDGNNGGLCEGGVLSCGSDNLDNCDSFDVYRQVKVLRCTESKNADGKWDGSGLVPLSSVDHCPDLAALGDLPCCLEAPLGVLCEANGECGSNNSLDNCGSQDVYSKVGRATEALSPSPHRLRSQYR